LAPFAAIVGEIIKTTARNAGRIGNHVELTKSQIQVSVEATAKDESRFNLTFVCIENDRLVSTDGHRLNIVTVSKADDPRDAFYIHRSGLDRVAKGMKASDTCELRLERENSQLIAIAYVRGVEIARLQVNRDGATEIGEYPNYKMVIPSAFPSIEIGFNPKYLKAAADSANRMGAHVVKLSIVDSLTAVEFTNEEVGFRSVLMPMRLK
jgi:DNA polymerase III sliding clamp (beta) subunit (PCNA family)